MYGRELEVHLTRVTQQFCVLIVIVLFSFCRAPAQHLRGELNLEVRYPT